MRVRTLVKQAFRDLFLNCDMVLAPARLGPAPKVAEPLNTPGPSTKSRGGLIPGGNLAGLPALSLPCGFAEGLPVAISLLGRPFYENQLIAIGNLFQKQTDWHRRRPPLE
jgi:aspartyl-tRNA(Asn)/glutamyl-tRNA(Gln) amidotransferase subunit A